MTRRMEIVAIIVAGLAALGTAYLIERAAIDPGDVIACGRRCEPGELVYGVPPYAAGCECISHADLHGQKGEQ